jgi:hypothetical protein
MALPILVKTWQFSVNNTVAPQGSALATARLTIRTAIKDVLKGFGLNPWTVTGSSDSVSSGLDASDRWDSDTDLVWANAGTAHSWIVLRQTGIATNFELCIDLTGASANGTSMVCVVSPSSGFTGGTTLNRPTATDEQVLSSTSWGGNGTDIHTTVHAMQSTDGQCTRLIVCQDNRATGFMVFDVVKNPVSGWSNPSYSIVIANNVSSLAPVMASMFLAANARGRAGAVNMSLYTSTLVAGTGSNNNLPSLQSFHNDMDMQFPLFPMGIVSDTVGARGRHGELFDIWYGLTSNTSDRNSGGIRVGSVSYSDNINKKFAQFGNVIVPWDGSNTFIQVG